MVILLSKNLPSDVAGDEMRYDILYLVENVALVLAAGVLTRRAQGSLENMIYLHLVGASTLYAISSTVANLALGLWEATSMAGCTGSGADRVRLLVCVDSCRAQSTVRGEAQ